MTNPVTTFIEAASVPLDADHASATLDAADAILAGHPEVATANVYTAALLGDAPLVRSLIAAEPRLATATGGPRGWAALTYLCFSRYLARDRSRSAGFVEAATILLDAGADPHAGWFDQTQKPNPQWESLLYGAAGFAHHAGLAQLLLDRGVDPNDGETPYHAPETRDNDTVKVLVESGKLTTDNLAMMLLRKSDWHDAEGIQWLLEHGADPNRLTLWGYTAFHNAALSDNRLAIFESYLDHGANPLVEARPPATVFRKSSGRTVAGMAARRGRGDVLALFQRRGITVPFDGVERLIAACALADPAAVQSIAAEGPGLVSALLEEGGNLLAEFAGTGNTEGVRLLLDLGVPVAVRYARGDGYVDVAQNSMALHVAAWRAAHQTVKLLIARGAPVDALDGRGRSPLLLAVKACVDSYWMDRRSPESVEALLGAGASIAGVPFPSGYADVDALLERHGAAGPPPG